MFDSYEAQKKPGWWWGNLIVLVGSTTAFLAYPEHAAFAQFVRGASLIAAAFVAGFLWARSGGNPPSIKGQ